MLQLDYKNIRDFNLLGGSTYAKIFNSCNSLETMITLSEQTDFDNNDDYRAQFGDWAEPIIRDLYNELKGTDYVEVGVTNTDYPGCKGMLDGYDKDLNKFIEIKTGNYINYNQIDFYTTLTQMDCELIKFDRDGLDSLLYCDLDFMSLEELFDEGEDEDFEFVKKVIAENFEDLIRIEMHECNEKTTKKVTEMIKYYKLIWDKYTYLQTLEIIDKDEFEELCFNHVFEDDEIEGGEISDLYIDDYLNDLNQIGEFYYFGYGEGYDYEIYKLNKDDFEFLNK